jgi:non-ribosomal peptide synthetase component F
MVQVETGRCNFDLKLSLQNTTQRLAGGFGYSTALFEVSTIKRMIEHFDSLLESILADPEKPLADLRMRDQIPKRNG